MHFNFFLFILVIKLVVVVVIRSFENTVERNAMDESKNLMYFTAVHNGRCKDD